MGYNDLDPAWDFIYVKDVLFKPQRARATNKQIKVTEDGSSTVLLLKELVHEQVHSRTKRINGEVSNILCKDKERKCCTEGQVSECGLEIFVRLLIVWMIEGY